MTISEQLQFSVLTAPVAALDRRALSQAWYSALYGSGSGAQTAVKMCAAPAAPQRAGKPSTRNTQTPAQVAPNPLRAKSAPSTAALQLNPSERRAPRTPLARKMERAFIRHRSEHHRAAFTVEGAHGRVRVLLQTRGGQLRIVAICPAKARSHVAAALAQARYALAARGIVLDAQMRGSSR